MILSPAFVWISRRPGARSRLVNLALIRLSDGILTYYFLLFAGAFIGSNKVAGRDGATLSAPGSLRMGRLPLPEKNKAPYLATRCRVNRLSAALTDPRLPLECLQPTAG